MKLRRLKNKTERRLCFAEVEVPQNQEARKIKRSSTLLNIHINMSKHSKKNIQRKDLFKNAIISTLATPQFSGTFTDLHLQSWVRSEQHTVSRSEVLNIDLWTNTLMAMLAKTKTSLQETVSRRGNSQPFNVQYRSGS